MKFPLMKDVSTSGVTNEEEAILRAQQLDLIYSQSGILYEIIPEAPRPAHDAEKPKPRPHADGVVGSINSSTIEYLSKQIHQSSVKHSTRETTKAAPYPKMQIFLHRTLRREINKPVGKRREEKRVRETKTSKNPQTMLMGEKKKRRRSLSLVSCAKRTTLLTFVPLWIKPRSCLKLNNRLS